VPRFTQELVSLYIRARGGYEFRLKENVDLHEALSTSISKADLLFLTVNLPDGNHFELSNKARMGQRLSFQRRTNTRTIDFDVLLPPIRPSTPSKSQDNENGVRFSFQEMADLIRSRSEPFQLIDLTCFSQKHIKDWLSAADDSRHASLIIGSERGQQAEGTLDVVPQVDLMLKMMNLLADERQNEALQTLKEGVGFFRMIERWTGLKSSFEPISSNDELYSKWKSATPRATLIMTDLRDKSRSWRFNPIPEIIE
jgi:hypothetical protein